jgi:hypothetical protein
MYIDRIKRLELITNFIHKKEEIWLKSLGKSEEEISQVTNKPIDFENVIYPKETSIYPIIVDAKHMVTDQYYEKGGIDFESDMVLEKFTNLYKDEQFIAVYIHGRKIETISIVKLDDKIEMYLSRSIWNNIFRYENPWFVSNYFCPKCFSEKHETTSLLINYSKCQCGWHGNNDKLVTKDEIKNYKRTKLIDKILI